MGPMWIIPISRSLTSVTSAAVLFAGSGDIFTGPRAYDGDIFGEKGIILPFPLEYD